MKYIYSSGKLGRDAGDIDILTRNKSSRGKMNISVIDRGGAYGSANQ